MTDLCAMALVALASVAADPWQPPSPPAELQRWYDRGGVRFEFYAERTDRQAFPATTHFDLRYQYRWRGRWGVRNRGGTRELIIRPGATQIELKVEHRIELPEAYRRDDLFETRLVRHEMDHVRISSDPRWQSLFERWVREVDEIRYPLAPGETADGQLIERLIAEAIDEHLERLRELVEIRYQELDRVTRHGLDPLPAGFFDRPVGPLSERDESAVPPRREASP